VGSATIWGVALKSVLFVQGAGDMHDPQGSIALVRYLGRELGDGYRVVAPEMPDAVNPRYEPWREAIERELAALDDPVLVVGHSLGGSVLLKLLAEGRVDRPMGGLFLASVPWWGPDGWDYDEFAVPDDVGSRLPAVPIFLYHSEDDPEVPFEHVRLHADRLPGATVRPIRGSQHSFLDGLPELVADIRGQSRAGPASPG
jgi:predicted alpha/beta hydrolase family esterase